MADFTKAVNNEVGIQYPVSKSETERERGRETETEMGVYSRMQTSIRDYWRQARAHLSAILDGQRRWRGLPAEGLPIGTEDVSPPNFNDRNFKSEIYRSVLCTMEFGT